ncbi:MAG: serine/threonine protein kinase with repeat, partial [Candidatus Angelobacter sp.]|nr:serine/threonine protein kinase with repeat [Candidatus Angelobacter sp.]
PQWAADPHYRERFLKEAERASRVINEHLATVHDVLQHDGEAFLVMEFVKGHNLRQRLESPLSIEDFFDVAAQSLKGLAAAHEHGILHCDIKPENIMVGSDGRVKLLDFGLAKQISYIGSQETVADSGSGISGTPAYMSPEVLLEKRVDQRSDIFSLGVVFYEALAGHHPFRTDTFIGTSDRVLKDTPPALHRFNPNVPAALEGIIFKMLEKRPEDRYSSVAELLHDIRLVQAGAAPPGISLPRHFSRKWRTPALVTLAFLLITALLAFAPSLKRLISSPRTAASPGATQVAVLSFTSANGDASTSALSRGLAENLTVKLTQLTDRYPLQVVPASEIRAQSVNTVDQANANLGAGLVVEGNLQQSGERMRVNFSLVDAHTRRQLRAGTITAEVNDPFSLEDRVVDSVLKLLDVELAAQDRALITAHTTTQPAAYDFYLRGRGYLQDYEKPENIDSAIAVFNRALDHDPNYALAYAGLGESFWHKYEHTHDSNWLDKSTTACERANTLGPNLANGSTCLGMVYNETGNYEKAARQFQRALQLDPTSDDSYRGLAFAYEHLQNFDDAEAIYRRAISLRPHYWAGYNWLGSFYVSRGRYADAVEMFKQVVALAPDSFRGHSNLGATYLAWGRYSDAVPILERSIAIRPTAVELSNLGAAYFYQRRFPDAARTYEQALRLDSKRFDIVGNLAEAYYWIPGKRPQSIATYKQAIPLAEQAVASNPRDSGMLTTLAVYYAMVGDRTKAARLTRQGVALAPNDPEILLTAALAFAQIRDDDQTLRFVEQSIAAGLNPNRIADSPSLDRFGSNPRLKDLVQQTYVARK